MHKSVCTAIVKSRVNARFPKYSGMNYLEMTAANPNATYVCVNKGETFCPKEIESRAICIDGDITAVVKAIL